MSNPLLKRHCVRCDRSIYSDKTPPLAYIRDLCGPCYDLWNQPTPQVTSNTQSQILVVQPISENYRRLHS